MEWLNPDLLGSVETTPFPLFPFLAPLSCSWLRALSWEAHSQSDHGASQTFMYSLFSGNVIFPMALTEADDTEIGCNSVGLKDIPLHLF